MSERELPPTDSLSPEMQRLIKSQISRRTALTGAGALGMTAFLAACGTKGTANTNTASTQKATADLSDSEKKLVVSNWPLYIDVDAKDESKHPTIDAFTSQTGVQVSYTDDVSDNNVFFGKIRNQLAAGQIGRAHV